MTILAVVLSLTCNHSALCVCRLHASFSWLLYQLDGSFAMVVKLAVPLECVNNVRWQRGKPCWNLEIYTYKSRFVALKQKLYIWCY